MTSLSARILRPVLLLTPLSLILSGCTRFHQQQHEYAYVSARQVYLHDRVAAVSNRVAAVTNGETLEVLEHGRRFLKVRTPKGEIGWLEEHAVIDDKLYAQFQDLAKKHAQDPPVATAQLRDDLYLHVQPGRETAHFLVIPGNARVQLLARGTVAKAPPPGTAVPKPKAAPAAGSTPATAPKAGEQAAKPPAPAPAATENVAANSAASVPPAPVAMEDWWLVRDSQGHTGWLLSGRLDVDIPDEVGAYAEGQKMVGAYPIAKVTDYETFPRDKEKGGEHEKKTGKAVRKAAEDTSTTPDPGGARPTKEYTEYVTVLAPPRSGLPFDFDQIRVFTWSMNHHRYETAYRLHGIQGYLPVKLSQENVNGQQEPVFSFQIASGPNLSIDPDTGVTRPIAPRTLSFRLEGNLVKRTGADQAPIILTRPGEDPANPKPAGGKSAKKKKR